MFKKIIEDIIAEVKESNRTPVSVDPSRFGDRVAEATGWTWAKKKDEPNFGTHKLVEVTPYRIEFRATIGSKLLSTVFLLVGLGPLTGLSFYLISQGEIIFNIETIFLILFGLVFAGVGVLMFCVLAKPIVFDKTIGRFYKGKKPSNEMLGQFEPGTKDKSIPLDRIHALQLIAKQCSSRRGPYYRCELNLVLGDGERINVVEHGKLKMIQEDAKTLSNFLGKPVWDGT